MAATFTRIRNDEASDDCKRPALEIRIFEYPAMAVDHSAQLTRRDIYIAYAADPDGDQNSGDDSDIFVVRSKNFGASWSAPVNVIGGPSVTRSNDDTALDDFIPFVTVEPPSGRVNVFYYDRLSYPGNPIGISRSISDDGGATWRNYRVNGSFGVPSLNPKFDPKAPKCYMGEYNTALARGDGVYLAWGDNRRETFTDKFPENRHRLQCRDQFRAVF